MVNISNPKTEQIQHYIDQIKEIVNASWTLPDPKELAGKLCACKVCAEMIEGIIDERD